MEYLKDSSWVKIKKDHVLMLWKHDFVGTSELLKVFDQEV